MAKNEKGEYIVSEGHGESKLKSYNVKEYNGLIYVWIHVKEELKPYGKSIFLLIDIMNLCMFP
jgi:phenylpropionate dioxygenase-like ring-hydroxylating dioxygenase large terminal subunit